MDSKGLRGERTKTDQKEVKSLNKKYWIKQIEEEVEKNEE
jgi:hypothetical protein